MPTASSRLAVINDMSKGVFERKNAQEDIPKTNPLLRALFVNLTGHDLKENHTAGLWKT
ncbi:hypothetical protein AGMMS50248_04600 [Deltaproteobacteria bacterium]|nr:hypothetical protein AGMMS49925_05340 [Deltaproteobacteria bacterium]GHU98285.1 hypothetical protein AGMMS50248_04600 [Deltaproteobacteria bacterium]